LGIVNDKAEAVGNMVVSMLFSPSNYPRLYNACWCISQEATDSESQKMLYDLLIVCS
jgi:hypothetical protein